MRNLLTFARLLSGLLLLILVAIVAYWIMQLAAPRPVIAPSGIQGEVASSRSLAAAAAAFGRPGAAAPVVAAPTNIQVVGVAESGEHGVAILAVDGKPAEAFAVGSKVNDSTRLLSAVDGKVVLEQNGRQIEVDAPQRPSLAVLTSGAGKPREPGQASPSPPSRPPGSFNLPPRAAPPAYTPPPQPPTVTPPVAAPNMPPQQQPPPQQPQQDSQPMPPPNPNATQPAYPPQYTPPQFDAPQFNPQTGQSSSGVITPGVPLPTQSPGNPALGQNQ